MDDIILIYTIFSDMQETTKITNKLFQKKLCACVNIIPSIISMYRWPEQSDKVIQADEVAAVIKTTKDNFTDIEKLILEMHSYDLPCILSLEVDQVTKNYSNWLLNQLN
ncbi:MAG: divalent-cation tolerance protein CutA [Parachlamydiales bacterium]|nr:divalent-cation tolerance protein CutA [Parachlamydiales bacterium]